MTSIFLFSLILGGGLLALSVFGDLFGAGDVELDGDVDVEVDGGGDGDLSVDAFRLFTIRNLTYFLFGFGAIGWLLLRFRPELSIWTITASASAGGVLAAGLATVLFGWIKATESGGREEEGSFVGCEARVLLPVRHGRVGRIAVRRGAREYELRALPFTAGARDPERWRHVVVVDMEGGTARVSPMEALAPAPDEPATT